MRPTVEEIAEASKDVKGKASKMAWMLGALWARDFINKLNSKNDEDN